MESVDNNRINLDLSLNIEYSVEEVSSKNGSSEIIVGRNIIDEVEEIGISEKENIVISSQNIEINGFLQESSEGDTSKESNIVPFVGQIFLSEEEAFIFYKRYAYQHRFSVRKGRFIKQNRIVSRRDFFCHREGRTSLKIIERSKEQRNRESTRCECKAHLRISLQKTHDMFPSEWRVTTFIVDNNHTLLTQSEVRFLPVNRIISDDYSERIFLLKEGGLSVRQLMRIIELEKNVEHGYLPFIEKDVRNLFLKAKKKVEITDVVDLLKYCEDVKKSCSKFQYAYTLDEERRLEHIFWSHAYCFDWYQEYGDVVVFNTTYKEVERQHDNVQDGEERYGKVHDGLDTHEGSACVMNEGGMVGFISYNDNEDAIFEYDIALEIAFNDYDDSDDFVDEEMDTLIDYDNAQEGTSNKKKHKWE
ncbi:hypothetical protein KIW84_034151 [Lathyrus oleraceus]|uniref:Protein FAR1-RELATED SEQUENCE n=1 Tax=Pisum sativum TaxID=3888 RepID=A0A9D4Y388_PEA|nr:hypothetical protein KIW84_034151 [Pisum sativum]